MRKISRSRKLVPFVEGVRCVYCSGGIVCVKERYYCFECGERIKVAEHLSSPKAKPKRAAKKAKKRKTRK